MSNTKYWLCCGSTDSYHGPERVGQCTEARSGNPDRCRFGTREDHKEYLNAGTAKDKAAIATLERLGYKYHGGEQWEPPITFGHTQRKTMEQLQRESNYRMSVQIENAAHGWEGVAAAKRLMDEVPVPSWANDQIRILSSATELEATNAELVNMLEHLVEQDCISDSSLHKEAIVLLASAKG